MEENSVWTVEMTLTDSLVLHMKWVWNDADGKIKRFEARLVPVGTSNWSG